MSILKIDEKWSIEYDPKNNDRPVAWLRYENKSHPFDHVNAVTAMFYALREDRTKLAKAVEALRQIADPISLAQGNVNAEIARATLEEIKGESHGRASTF